jgi:enoyl-CoA hydratase
MMMDKKTDVGRRAHRVGEFIDECQRHFTSIERCARPVVAAVNGGCIGAGLGLLTATDVRYASADAYFSIKVRGCSFFNLHNFN